MVKGTKGKTNAFVACELTELTKLEASTAQELRTLLLKAALNYDPSEALGFGSSIDGWDGVSLLETGTSGSAGQSGDTWLVGPRKLVEDFLDADDQPNLGEMEPFSFYPLNDDGDVMEEE